MTLPTNPIWSRKADDGVGLFDTYGVMIHDRGPMVASLSKENVVKLTIYICDFPQHSS
jgi:hypothetical protein